MKALITTTLLLAASLAVQARTAGSINQSLDNFINSTENFFESVAYHESYNHLAKSALRLLDDATQFEGLLRQSPNCYEFYNDFEEIRYTFSEIRKEFRSSHNRGSDIYIRADWGNIQTAFFQLQHSIQLRCSDDGYDNRSQRERYEGYSGNSRSQRGRYQHNSNNSSNNGDYIDRNRYRSGDYQTRSNRWEHRSDYSRYFRHLNGQRPSSGQSHVPRVSRVYN